MEQPVWRSLLYTPAHLQKYARKASAGLADVVILDLEDSVPQAEKSAGRALLSDSAAMLHAAGKPVAVRINGKDENQSEDIGAAAAAGADILILPKVESAAEICQVAQALIAKLPSAQRPRLIALIETPAGLLNAPQIAGAHPMLTAINLGTEDFCREMEMEPCWETLLHPSQQITLAARMAGIIPLGYAGSIAAFAELTEFARIIEASARLGFEGGFAIHPAQLEPLNRAYSPSVAQIAEARKVVSAFEAADAKGIGAISVDGRMVDLPVALRARKTLARARVLVSTA